MDVNKPVLDVVAGGLYSLARVVGDQIVVAGMTPKRGDTLVRTGRLGQDIDVAEAADLAGLATERAVVVAQAAAASHARRVVSIAQMTVYVAVTEDFTAISAVADGATRAIASLGEPPARAAIGVLTLPGGAPVEVQLTAIMGEPPANITAH